MAFVGSGYPLYFDFLKFCSILMLVLLLTSGGYNLYTNYYYGNTCKNPDEVTSNS